MRDGERLTIAITRTGIPGFCPSRVWPSAELREWPETTPPTPGELAELLAPADGLLCQSSDQIGVELLDRCPRLRVVSTMSAGTDHLDLPALADRRIAVGHTPDIPTEATADLTFALILAARRRLVEASRWVRQGHWTTTELNGFIGQDVHGATLGIIGYGAIGRAVARRATGFAMPVIQHSRRGESDHLARWVPLDELLRTADVVSLHTPLTRETRHLIGARELTMMKPTSVLVNTARGGVVDPHALRHALMTGGIAAAALDVMDVEPPGPGNPLVSADNCIVIPHIGSATYAARQRMAELAVANLDKGLRGEHMLYPVPINSTISPLPQR